MTRPPAYFIVVVVVVVAIVVFIFFFFMETKLVRMVQKQQNPSWKVESVPNADTCASNFLKNQNIDIKVTECRLCKNT